MTGVVKRQALGLALSLVSILTLMNAFTSSIFVFLLPTLLLCAAVLRFCEAVRERKAALYYLFAAALVLALVIFLANRGSGPIGLWFVTATLGGGDTAYFAALFIVSVFFYPAAVFYFTNVVYRAPVLLLLTLIAPSLLYSRREPVPPLSAALLVTLFFLLMMAHANRARPPMRSLGLFALPLFLLSFLLAFVKPPALFSNANRPAANPNAGIGWEQLGYTATSSPSGGGTGPSQIMFLVEADEPLYMTRQVFGKYDGLRWLQITEAPYVSGYYAWESQAAARSFDDLFAAIRELAGEDAELAARFGGALPSRRVEQRKQARILPQNVSTRYVLAPMRTYRVSGVRSGIDYIRNAADEYFLTGSGRMDPNVPYTLNYYSDVFRSDPELQAWAEGFDAERFRDFIDALYWSLPQNVISVFAEDWENALGFPEYAGDYESPELTALALQITEGLSGDYQKAVALEAYFRDFTYSLGYAPPPDRADIEYFLFESRTGACGQFATAMTLMARAAGLNARYVEGFAATEASGEGQYLIRGSSSHAYTQVFIAPYGWVTFEPTQPRFETTSVAEGIIRALTDSGILSFFAALTAVSAAGLLIYLLYTAFVAETLFRRRAMKKSGSQAVLLLFRKISRLVSARLGLPNLSAGGLVGAVREQYGTDLGYAAGCYERAAYNGEELTPAEKEAVFDAYSQCYSRIKTRGFEKRRSIPPGDRNI